MNLSDFAAAMEATWPPQALHRAGPWAVRQGAGGGKRVSAASPVGDWRADDIALADTYRTVDFGLQIIADRRPLNVRRR